MSDYGRLRGLPPYVGGDDDEITSWRAECDCGFRGRETPYQSIAEGELRDHLNEVIARLRDAVEHYADLRHWAIDRHPEYAQPKFVYIGALTDPTFVAKEALVAPRPGGVSA